MKQTKKYKRDYMRKWRSIETNKLKERERNKLYMRRLRAEQKIS